MDSYLYEDLYVLEKKHWWHNAKRNLLKKLLARYVTKKPLTLLDVGCGVGSHMDALKSWGQVWGIDVSPIAVDFCKKRGFKNVSVQSADNTKFTKNKFDVITMLDVLEHTDDKKTLAEIQRILKPKGILIITVPAFNWLWSQWDVVLHHKKRYVKSDLIKLMGKDFSLLKVSYLYSYLVAPAYLIRKIKEVFFKKNYGSDFSLSNHFINIFMKLAVNIEQKMFFSFGLPFGLTLVVVGKKN